MKNAKKDIRGVAVRSFRPSRRESPDRTEEEGNGCEQDGNPHSRLSARETKSKHVNPFPSNNKGGGSWQWILTFKKNRNKKIMAAPQTIPSVDKMRVRLRD